MAKVTATVAALLVLLIASLPACCSVPHHQAFVEGGVLDATGTLGAGDILTVIARATPGYQCVFAIPHVVDNGYMREVAPGVYVGTHAVQTTDNAVQVQVKVSLKGVGASVSKLLEPPISIVGLQQGRGDRLPRVSFAHYPYRPSGLIRAGDTLFVLLHTLDDNLKHYSFNSTAPTGGAPDFHYGPDGTLVAWRTVQNAEPPGAFDVSVWYFPPTDPTTILGGRVPGLRATAGPPAAPPAALAARSDPQAMPAIAAGAPPEGSRRARADTGDADFSVFAPTMRPEGRRASAPARPAARRHPAVARSHPGRSPASSGRAARPPLATAFAAPRVAGRTGAASSGLGGQTSSTRSAPREVPGESSAAGPAPARIHQRTARPLRKHATRRPHSALRRRIARHARSARRRVARARHKHPSVRRRVAQAPRQRPTGRRLSPALRPASRVAPAATRRSAPVETGAEGGPAPSASPEGPAALAPPPTPPVPTAPTPAASTRPPYLVLTELVRTTHLVWPNFAYRLRISVGNEGGRPAPACRLHYALDPAPGSHGGAPTGVLSVPPLGPGESETLVSDPLPTALRGRYTVRVWLEGAPNQSARTASYSF